MICEEKGSEGVQGPKVAQEEEEIGSRDTVCIFGAQPRQINGSDRESEPDNQVVQRPDPQAPPDVKRPDIEPPRQLDLLEDRYVIKNPLSTKKKATPTSPELNRPSLSTLSP